MFHPGTFFGLASFEYADVFEGVGSVWEVVLAPSFVTSHTSPAFPFSMRCLILFSASQRHRAWDIRSERGWLWS
jgi:hypothetical protein